jgi:uncharacterized protein (DUF1778 family)
MAESTIISVRMSRQERAMIEGVAKRAHTNLSDYVRRSALEAADADLSDHRVFTVRPEDWEKFETWSAEPARVIPEIRNLMKP